MKPRSRLLLGYRAPFVRTVSTMTSINAKLDSALTSSKYIVPGQGDTLASYPLAAIEWATVLIAFTYFPVTALTS